MALVAPSVFLGGILVDGVWVGLVGLIVLMTGVEMERIGDGMDGGRIDVVYGRWGGMDREKRGRDRRERGGRRVRSWWAPVFIYESGANGSRMHNQ